MKNAWAESAEKFGIYIKLVVLYRIGHKKRDAVLSNTPLIFHFFKLKDA